MFETVRTSDALGAWGRTVPPIDTLSEANTYAMEVSAKYKGKEVALLRTCTDRDSREAHYVFGRLLGFDIEPFYGNDESLVYLSIFGLKLQLQDPVVMEREQTEVRSYRLSPDKTVWLFPNDRCSRGYRVIADPKDIIDFLETCHCTLDGLHSLQQELYSQQD